MKNWISLVVAAALVASGCKQESNSSSTGSSSGKKVTIQNKGSDTMSNLAQAWSEEYSKVAPNVSVDVSGGGSGVGIAALIKGTVDIANASRNIKASEAEQVKKNTGKEAKEYTVGYDALAIYVHKDNPLEEITIEQIAEIYKEGGTISKWSQLGVKVPGCEKDEIARASRQSSSGTYEFLREHVLKNKDFRRGAVELNGSKEVVEFVSSTPCGFGYSGMGYATPHVKMLRVVAQPGTKGVSPSVATATDKSYPIARSLHLYTVGEPEGEVKKFIEWTLSPAGQKIVQASGYVPVGASK